MRKSKSNGNFIYKSSENHQVQPDESYRPVMAAIPITEITFMDTFENKKARRKSQVKKFQTGSYTL